MEPEEMSKMLALVVGVIAKAKWQKDDSVTVPSYTGEADGWKVTLLAIKGMNAGAAAKDALVVRLPEKIATEAWTLAEKSFNAGRTL